MTAPFDRREQVGIARERGGKRAGSPVWRSGPLVISSSSLCACTSVSRSPKRLKFSVVSGTMRVIFPLRAKSAREGKETLSALVKLDVTGCCSSG